MNIAIIDADIIGRKKHRFPNLACEKLGGYFKEKGYKVVLKLNYENLEQYDKIYISKVFTDTKVPQEVLKIHNVKYGGTGFYYDKAPNLLYEIEHHMPDYTLYDKWIEEQIKKGAKESEFDFYKNYSIGFLTRGCFRKCEFCVNKKHNTVFLNSEIEEFYDPNRKYICLLDDNFLGYKNWKSQLLKLKSLNKYFVFKQGLDERLLTEEKCKLLSQIKYKGDYIFAFDNIEDRDVIENKLKLWKKYCKKTTKFYVLCGFDRQNNYDENFWEQDIIDTFERIKILMKYECLPYIMRYNEI